MSTGKENNTGIIGRRILPLFLTALFFVLLLVFGIVLRRTGAVISTAVTPYTNTMKKSGEDDKIVPLCNPDREVRGLWIPTVSNITYPSKPELRAEELRQELETIVRTAYEANLNTLCLQVRPASDALYDSALFPTSAFLSGEQGTDADEAFDPLAYLCTLAGEMSEPMAVYAWINPLRVTVAGQDVSLLSADNPAVVHPEWTVSYGGGLYYNAALPEVRELIADGVRELCEKYPIAGVIFDDYFYPYPQSAKDGSIMVFDDAEQYAALSETGQTLGDFRRENVNRMVKACYEAVKAVDPQIRFGVAPFGIWQNDDGENGGSDTRGLNAYSAIYCDALAWMEGGYVDFIAPQLYWTFDTAAARYDVLVRWWDAQCQRFKIPLLIAHATYSYEAWDTPGEMERQIRYARETESYRGSLFYGYPQVRDNTCGVTDEIRAAMSQTIYYYQQ